jgi:hypothetical protein
MVLSAKNRPYDFMKGVLKMTIAERITLIRAGYKIGEIREMEAKEAERHEPEEVEPVNGM